MSEVTNINERELEEAREAAREAMAEMGVEIKTFSTAHLKQMAIFLAKILDDQEVKGAVNYVVTQNAADVKSQAIPIIYAFVRVGFLKAADELDALLASLLDITPKEFSKLDGEMFIHPLVVLIDHPKFLSFLKAAQGMRTVMSKSWSTFSNTDTDGPTKLSTASTSNGSPEK